MKKRWIVLLLLFMMTGAVGYGFTREEAQKVQKVSSPKVQTVYLEYESEGVNPLEEDSFPDVNQAVEAHFDKMQEEMSYVEAYQNLHVYTKKGKAEDIYVAFVTYDMKIRGIYTEVPGLATFYIERSGDEMQLTAEPEDAEVQNYISRLTKHQDVQDLFNRVNYDYNQAVQSDALLRETLNELQSAYADDENPE